MKEQTTIDIFRKEADIALALCGETNINNLSKKNISRLINGKKITKK